MIYGIIFIISYLVLGSLISFLFIKVFKEKNIINKINIWAEQNGIFIKSVKLLHFPPYKLKTTTDKRVLALDLVFPLETMSIYIVIIKKWKVDNYINIQLYKKSDLSEIELYKFYRLVNEQYLS